MSQPIRPNSQGFFPDVFQTARAHFSGEVALGNGTQYRIRMFWHMEWLVVAVLEKGAYEFDGYVHPNYLMEKLNLRYMGDAENLADFINDQFQNKDPKRRNGSYDIRFCSDGQD